jgi:hypothetical protein
LLAAWRQLRLCSYRRKVTHFQERSAELQIPPLRFAPVGMTPLLYRAGHGPTAHQGEKAASNSFFVRSSQKCHPDRSEAQWRDLLFCGPYWKCFFERLTPFWSPNQVHGSKPTTLGVPSRPVVLRKAGGQCQQLLRGPSATARNQAVPQNHQRDERKQVSKQQPGPAKRPHTRHEQPSQDRHHKHGCERPRGT